MTSAMAATFARASPSACVGCWHRWGATLRQAPKRHLVCPSLAAAAMGVTADKLIREPKTLGALFESQVVRDLRVYAAVERGVLYHYRDSRGREIHAIVEYPDGPAYRRADGVVTCSLAAGGQFHSNSP